MTTLRDDIIRMAREAGSIDSEDVIQTVYAAFAAAEREECAKVAEKMLRFYTQAVTGVPEAIRARGNT